jgi:prepilin-type N-terminal cleavage/methylation domain-containing protein
MNQGFVTMQTAKTNPGSARVEHAPPRQGFTLVELMVVVAVIGLLAAIALPAFAKVRSSSQNSCFVASLRTAKGAFVQYSFEHGRYPPDVTPGIVPPGMADYLGSFAWTQPTSLGGQWDWDDGQFGFRAGVSVYQPSAPIEQMKKIDQMIDDGNLASGGFQARSAGYISVIED